ncbi:MAG: alpha/beta fold hydrolase [Propionibacteriales bacterium]|nr:alpha/beta fold hydrolase [Propionibacteriales bacterium]
MSDAIYAREVGESGERVAFLHGLFGQGRNFTQAAKALQPELRSLLVDLPNHGHSRWTDTVDYVDVADRVAAFLRERWVGTGRTHVVGHSMGGKVAMVLALRHPELVDRLVVVDIAPDRSEGADEFVHLLDSLASLDLTTLVRRGDADEQLRERIDNDTVRGFLLQNLRSVPAEEGGGFRWQANLDLLRRDLDVIGGFPEIDATFDRPVLWLAGERSAYVGPQHAERMRRLFPRTRLVTVKGAGHWVHSERPEAFVSALRTFLLA